MSLPDTMRVAVYRERGRLDVEDRPLPEVGPRDALLQVGHCGICGTDLHLVMDGWGRPGSVGGHEYAGRIVALGDEVCGYELDELVVGGAEAGCGRCEPCRAHRPSLCSGRSAPGVTPFQGAFAEFVRVDARQLVPVPSAVSDRVAALTEPLAVAMHGVTQSGIAPGRRALITGAGAIGLLVLASLRARGVHEVTVSEPSPTRGRLAEQVGASRVLEPSALEVPPMPFALVHEAFDVVFECSGHPEALQAGLAQLRKGGCLVILGSGMRRPKLDTNRVLINELVVTGAYNYDEDGFVAALELLASGRLPTERLIASEDVGLHQLQQAMERLVAGEIGGKVMVAPALR